MARLIPIRRRGGLVLGLLLAASLVQAAPAAPRQTPSGLPVPRYVTLKFNEVNARGGPGDDYRLLWVYRARGLPLQVVAETQEWRRVCDPRGHLAWVKATGVDGRRSVLYGGDAPLPLRAKPQTAARASALLAPRSVAELDRCKDGWCRIKPHGGSGWAPASAFWGVDERAQCR